MKRNILLRGIALGVLLIVGVLPVLADQIFVEGFGDSSLDTDGTDITTSNTNFTYVRIGSGGGAIESQNPSSLGGGVNNTNSMSFGGSTSGSPNCVGVTGLSSSNVTSANFRLKITANASSGDFIIRMGTGSSFGAANYFTTGDLMWAIQSDNGNLEYRTGSWNDFGQTLVQDKEYHFHIVANRSGSSIDNYYGSNSVADTTMDVWMDDGSGFSLIGDDVSITNNQDASAFQICQINGGTTVEFDNFEIDDSAKAPYTPTAVNVSSLSTASTVVLPAAIGLGLCAAVVVGLAVVVVRRRA